MKTVKLIGRGAFTKAYLMENGRVLLNSTDPIKECMALGWFPDSELFPTVEYVDLGTYEMEYYTKVRSLKNSLLPEEYALYLELRRLRSGYSLPPNKFDGYHELYRLFSHITRDDVREAMQEALEACANFGTDVGFEISPRNVAVKDGKLILLDCFFNISKLQEVRKS